MYIACHRVETVAGFLIMWQTKRTHVKSTLCMTGCNCLDKKVFAENGRDLIYVFKLI